MVFSILRMVTMPRNLVEILNQEFSFLSKSNLKSNLCPTQCIDCSLMRVFTSLGLKNLILLLGMRSCNEHGKMPKWGIFNASVLLNEHGHPPFLFQN